MARSIVIGNRVPTEYFVASGCGESDLGYHTGAFDAAIEEAGICNFNFMSYSSILPKGAKKVPIPKEYSFGAVLEAITAEAGKQYLGNKAPKRLVAGLITTKIFKGDEEAGGLVAEYTSEDDPAEFDEQASKDKAEEFLRGSINEIFNRRYNTKECRVEVNDIIIKSFIPKKKYGCAIIVMGFTKYNVPLKEQEAVQEESISVTN